MKTEYVVQVRAGLRGEIALPAQRMAASNVHYAVRECLFALRHQLPRNWKRLHIEVGRP